MNKASTVNAVTVAQIVPMTPELEQKSFELQKSFGSQLFNVSWFKRTKKFINGKGNEASRKLLPGEEPDYRSATVGAKVKKFNVGGDPAYNFKSHGLFHVNIFNEADRSQIESHGAIGWGDAIEYRHGGMVYHRNNDFQPVAIAGYKAPLLTA